MSKINRVIKQSQEILKNDTRGLTIQELAEKTKVTRVTVSLALAKLEGMGLVEVRVIGNCKLHYLRRSRDEKK